MLAAGRIDAMFDNGVYEAASVSEALRAGAHLVPITGPRVDQLRQTYPFFKQAVIPRGMYEQPSTVATIGVDSLLICRRDLSEQLVYELTARVFDVFRSLSASDFFDLVELGQAAATPVPLHDGAARFFREQALMR